MLRGIWTHPLTKGSRLTLVSPLADGSIPEDASQGGAGETRATPAEEAARPEFEVVAGDPETRRYPSTIGGACYLVILGAMVVAFVIVSTGRWRTGVHWLAGALVVAAALRACLRSRDAGMLAVRGRWFDVGLLLVTGVALWVLGTSVPDA